MQYLVIDAQIEFYELEKQPLQSNLDSYCACKEWISSIPVF